MAPGDSHGAGSKQLPPLCHCLLQDKLKLCEKEAIQPPLHAHAWPVRLESRTRTSGTEPRRGWTERQAWRQRRNQSERAVTWASNGRCKRTGSERWSEARASVADSWIMRGLDRFLCILAAPMFTAAAATAARIGRQAASAVPRQMGTMAGQQPCLSLSSIRSLRLRTAAQSPVAANGLAPATRMRVPGDDSRASGAAASLRRFVRATLLVGVPLAAAYQWMEQQCDVWLPVARAESKQKTDVAASDIVTKVSQSNAPSPSSPPLRRPSGHVFIATSLDGFISRPDGDIEWLLRRDQAGENHGYDDFIRGVDGILMGRGTFEKVAAFDPWPYTKPVVVLSKTLAGAPLPPQLTGRDVRVLNLSPQATLDHLSREGWHRVYIDGGQLIQSCLREGLIDDLVITTVPVLIGEGRPLFGAIQGAELDLTHVHTKAFPSGLVQSLYRVQTGRENNAKRA